MDTIYIETSIVSHATAWPSSDIQIAAIQHQARTWWSTERPNFELVTSQLVIDEASAGDPSAAADRLKLLDGVPTVPIDDDVRALARAIVSASIMPPRDVDSITDGLDRGIGSNRRVFAKISVSNTIDVPRRLLTHFTLPLRQSREYNIC